LENFATLHEIVEDKLSISIKCEFLK